MTKLILCFSENEEKSFKLGFVVLGNWTDQYVFLFKPSDTEENVIELFEFAKGVQAEFTSQVYFQAVKY